MDVYPNSIDLYSNEHYTDINILLPCCGVSVSRMLFEKQLARCNLCPFIKCMTDYCARHRQGTLLPIELICQLTPFTINIYVKCCRRYINKANNKAKQRTGAMYINKAKQRTDAADLLVKIESTTNFLDISRQIVDMPCCSRQVDIWDIQEKVLRARVFSKTGCLICKIDYVQLELLLLFEPIARLHYSDLWVKQYNQINSKYD